MDVAHQVALAFRAVLRREADLGGLATYTRAIEGGHDLAWLIKVLMDSSEYRALGERMRDGHSFPLDNAPPMSFDPACSPAEKQALWNHLAQTWTSLGDADPYWSVLTEDRFRGGTLDPAALAVFHESGAEEVRRLNAWLGRAGLSLGPGTVCAEFGCGVGRVTRSLALQFGQVIGFDVSASHLAIARAQMATEGLTNIAFVLVRGPADLAALGGADLFYSVISLQHSPPPVILDVLEYGFAGLRPGGCAFFQVPTYARGYHYGPGCQLGVEMEMHVVPQRTILDLAHRCGLVVAEVQPDWCAGRPGEWISSTFLLLRPGPTSERAKPELSNEKNWAGTVNMSD